MSFIDKIRDRLFGFNQPSPTHETPNLIKKTQVASPASEAKTSDNRDILEHKYPERILFVCSGNICRSAYAAAKLKQLTQGMAIQIASAGTLRIVGQKAAPEMLETARENGVELEDHRSSALSRLFIDSSDLIFAMAPEHRDIILSICPDAEKRTLLLGMFLDEPQEELEDPMGKAPEIYRAVAAQIDEALTNWVQKRLTPQELCSTSSRHPSNISK